MRRYLTAKGKAAIMRQQGWKCGCGCGCPVWPGAPVEYDHTLPLALGGQALPDAALTPHCHRLKTGQDIGQIRKADRQGKAHRGEKKRRGKTMQSRGFQGHRKFDGTPVWRERT